MPKVFHRSILHPRTLIPVAAGALFVFLALAISTGRDFGIDRTLILMMRQADDPSEPLGPAWFREAVRDMTAFGSMTGLGLITIAATLTLWLCRFRHLAIGLVVAVLGATAISNILKTLVGRERPDIVEHTALTFTASFPSGHAFISAVTYLCIAGFVGLASRREDIGRLCVWLAWIMLLLVGLSRLYLGVHWPTDVLGGWALGVAWSSIAVAYLGRRMAKADPEPRGVRSAHVHGGVDAEIR